jgi:hypothetical protein
MMLWGKKDRECLIWAIHGLFVSIQQIIFLNQYAISCNKFSLAA